MPNSPLKILVVEDAKNVAEVMQSVVQPILERFPGSEVIVTPSLSEALRIMDLLPRPDVITLDLTLEDSSLEQTMSKVEEIDSKCPVVLVTGGDVQKWSAMLNRRHIEVIQKGRDWLTGNVLVLTILRAITRGQTREAKRVSERIALMRRIDEELTHAAT